MSQAGEEGLREVISSSPEILVFTCLPNVHFEPPKATHNECCNLIISDRYRLFTTANAIDVKKRNEACMLLR